MIERLLEETIIKRIGKGKIVLLLGPRQSGKTTLARAVAGKSGLDTLWLSGDEPDIRAMLAEATSTRLKSLIGRKKLVVIDEAQRIPAIGNTLKLLVDLVAGVQVLATGSSAFELARETSEPLTGRKYEFHLYPLSFAELTAHFGSLEEERLLAQRLIFGSYPEVVTHPGEEPEILSLLADSYLYKDIFALGQVKKPAVLERILQALALQLGSEVTFHEVAQIVGADKETVERYIDLLEKAYVIFRLTTLSRNLRNELKRSRKIYFWDTGIRNAVIRNYSQLNLRPDTGALWENYLVSERLKANHYFGRRVNSWFWRTQAQQEIDYVEEGGGVMRAWEFKWRATKPPRIPRSFTTAYPEAIVGHVSNDDVEEFLGAPSSDL
jgi:predicted AAA+ superfamily ATPase